MYYRVGVVFVVYFRVECTVPRSRSSALAFCYRVGDHVDILRVVPERVRVLEGPAAHSTLVPVLLRNLTQRLFRIFFSLFCTS